MLTGSARYPRSAARTEVLRRVAEAVPASPGEDCVRVAVDGVDGAGKTVFAAELAEALEQTGRAVVRVSVDDFHHVAAIRYRRGRTSPQGFFLDSFDYDRLRADVLEPLGQGGSRQFRRAAHDLASDRMLDPPYDLAPAGAVLVLDGLFLHRHELASTWDFSVLLEVPFDVTAARMAGRDGTSPDPDDPGMRRYVEAQRHYFATCDPRKAATVVIDNADVDRPRVTRWP